MDLNEFLTRYDQENAVILLEGKRKVLKEDENKLVSLGKMLAQKMKKAVFRSGNADGADTLFLKGVSMIDSSKIEIIKPYKEHTLKINKFGKVISLDDITLTQEHEIAKQTILFNKKHKKTFEQYFSGIRNRYTWKVAYLLRDTVKVIGIDELPPATFGIFYDDLNNPNDGGTGFTMDICRYNNVPFIDQKVWFSWI